MFENREQYIQVILSLLRDVSHNIAVPHVIAAWETSKQ